MSAAVNGTKHARYEDELALELDGAIEITDVPASPNTRLASGVLLALAVVVTALNLRPSVTSVAPLLGEKGTLGPLTGAAQERVKSGRYASVSEVVRAGLRALDREDIDHEFTLVPQGMHNWWTFAGQMPAAWESIRGTLGA